MRNKFKGHETASVLLAKDQKAGEIFVSGALVGVLINDGKKDELAEIELRGQFFLPVAAGVTLACGDKVYVDGSGHVTKTASGEAIGVSVEGVPAGASEAVILIG